MFVISFWRDACERAIRTFAQAVIALLAVDGIGITDVDWPAVGGVGALAALVSLLTSLVSTKVGDPDDPSLLR